jgi:hypothetical protein
VVPALLNYLTSAWGQPNPGRDNRKGAVFTLRYDRASGSVEARGPSTAFAA